MAEPTHLGRKRADQNDILKITWAGKSFCLLHFVFDSPIPIQVHLEANSTDFNGAYSEARQQHTHTHTYTECAFWPLWASRERCKLSATKPRNCQATWNSKSTSSQVMWIISIKNQSGGGQKKKESKKKKLVLVTTFQ